MNERGCAVVELRQYTLRPGTTSAFVELFEREFVDTQEAVGMRILGTFTDLDDPDRFVWLRGFADMATRRAGLTAFYYGPCWQRHRDEANGMMIDSDNVRLLKPVADLPRLDMVACAPEARQGWRVGPIAIAVQPVVQIGAGSAHSATALDELQGVLGVYETDPVENNFPQLPVIEDERVVVVVMESERRSETDIRAAAAALAGYAGWTTDRPATVLRLAPTPRSRLG